MVICINKISVFEETYGLEATDSVQKRGSLSNGRRSSEVIIRFNLDNMTEAKDEPAATS